MRRRCGNCRVWTDSGPRLPRASLGLPRASLALPRAALDGPWRDQPDTGGRYGSGPAIAREVHSRGPGCAFHHPAGRGRVPAEAECRQRPTGSRRRARGAAPADRRSRAERPTVACVRTAGPSDPRGPSDTCGCIRWPSGAPRAGPGTCAPYAEAAMCRHDVRSPRSAGVNRTGQLRRPRPVTPIPLPGAAGAVSIRRREVGGSGVFAGRRQMRAPVAVAGRRRCGRRWLSLAVHMRAPVARLDRAPCASLSAAGGVAPRGQTGRDSSVGRARD